ncbi:MAG: TonB-dependent receptor, partial [Steroidobacteraceae bacterium]
ETCARTFASVLLAISAVPAVQAQSTEGDPGLEEVVVTARLRSETVQDAPISVNVATDDALERVAATSLLDLPRAVPGLILQKAPNSSQTGVTLRGLGSSPGAASFESSVGLFVNGAYVPRTREFAASLFDIERVEVVRGTQSSLLGKNTSLGAVNVVTKTPGHELAFNASANYETELDSWTGSGGLTVPLGEQLAMRVAAQSESLGGWVKNAATGKESEEVERDSGRVTFAWEPSDSFDATVVYETQEYDGQGMPAELIRATPEAFGLSALAGFPGLETDFDRVSASSDSRAKDAFVEESSVDRASATAHWHIGDFIVTSQTAWSQSDSDASAGTDFLPGDYFLQVTNLDAKSLSQELRLTSPAQERFRYVAGAYYGTNDFEQDNTFLANYPGAPPLSGDTVTHFDQNTDSWSLFGQVDFDLTAKLTVSGGLRYTDEQKDVDLARTVLQPGVMSLFVFPPYAPFDMSRSESVTDGLVNMSYKPSDGLMFYASWAQGTKSGGFADAATLLDESEYDSEVAQTAELGVRYRTSDGQLTANATVYSTDVNDYQLVTFTGTQFVIDNTDLEAEGIESEILWRPRFAPGLDISWRNTYSNAKDANTGEKTPRAPRWSGGLVLAYERDLAYGWRLTLDGSVDYESSQTHQRDPDAVPKADSLTMYGGGIGVKSDKGLSIRVIGRNLTDENRYTFVFPTPFLPPGNANAQSERPRTVALQVSYEY